MKSRTGYLFTQVTIILMVFCLCLPCTVKREIKQVLNIPAALAEHSEKPDKTGACPSFTKRKKQTKTFSYLKKDTQIYPYGFGFSFSQAAVLQLNVFLYPKIKKPSSVLIYILHEQYLI